MNVKERRKRTWRLVGRRRSTARNQVDTGLRRILLAGVDHGQHLREHASYLGEFAVAEHDVPCLAAESLGRDGTDLLGDDPTATGGYMHSMSPAGSLYAGERQDGYELPEGDRQMERGRNDEGRPVLALFAAAYGFEVDKPHLARLDLLRGMRAHSAGPVHSSLIGASAADSSAAPAR